MNHGRLQRVEPSSGHGDDTNQHTVVAEAEHSGDKTVHECEHKDLVDDERHGG
jgi:hypothetical protein